jgi:hypothetical protein
MKSAACLEDRVETCILFHSVLDVVIELWAHKVEPLVLYKISSTLFDFGFICYIDHPWA